MRTYPTNSPQAAARIVALAMLSDGHLCKRELDMLERAGAHGELGLSPREIHEVVHALCEDLLATSNGSWEAACRVNPETFAALMAEVDDPVLQAKVLRLCAVVVAADEHVTENESHVLAATVAHWRNPAQSPGPLIDHRGAGHV